MKYIYYYIVLLLIANSLYGCCDEQTHPNRTYFTINPEERKIIIPIQLDSITTANMVFDTGARWGAFNLDSTYYDSMSKHLNHISHPTYIGSAWASGLVPASIHNNTHPVKINNTELEYDYLLFTNWYNVLWNNYSEGLFNVPESDSTNIWELNFENNYLEIHPSTDFNMPEDCVSLSFNRDKNPPFVIHMPMQIRNNNGDTLIIDREYLLDTGMPNDIAIMSPTAEEADFFNKEEAVWTKSGEGYNLRYTVEASLFNDLRMDSLRIYTFDNKRQVGDQALIGLNFLKRFNVFFDMRNMQLGLQPINTFERIVNPDNRRFHYSTHRTQDDKFIVTMVADRKNNYYEEAGLQIEDEIVAINDTIYRNISYQQYLGFCKEGTLVLDIIQNKEKMKLIVSVDKDEEQGD